MKEEELNMVNRIKKWLNKEDEGENYITNQDLQELLNLIMKYKNLYEKEKEKNRELQNYMRQCLIPKSTIDYLYIRETEIESKIEQLNKEERQKLKGAKGQDRYSIKQEYMYRKSALQSLLEDKE